VTPLGGALSVVRTAQYAALARVCDPAVPLLAGDDDGGGVVARCTRCPHREHGDSKTVALARHGAHWAGHHDQETR